MHVSAITIKRVDHLLALIATVDYKDNTRKEVILETAPKASMLQAPYMRFLHDPESLEVEIDYRLSQYA